MADLDRTKIDFIQDGEPHEADVYNRPTKDLADEIDATYGQTKDALVDSAIATGFVGRHTSAVSCTSNSVTLTISEPTTIYQHSNKHIIEDSITLDLTDEHGGYYVMYDTTEKELYIQRDYPDFLNEILVAWMYSRPDVGVIWCGDERHSSTRNVEWHSAHHQDDGAIWRRGGDLDYTLDSESEVSLGLGDLAIADEDLVHIITHSDTPSEPYEQVLFPVAQLQVMYLDGEHYNVSTNSGAVPFLVEGGVAQYNEVIEGVGSLQPVIASGNGEGNEGSSGSKFVTYYMMVTNDQQNSVKLIMGRGSHFSKDEAELEEFENYGLPMPELVPMYKIIVEANSDFANGVKIAAVHRLRTRESALSDYLVPMKHDDLVGKNEPNQHNIEAITGLREMLDDIVVGGGKADGMAGSVGFGVGVCPEDELPSDLVGLNGYKVPNASNYGNYLHDNGSIMVFVPTFYYRVGSVESPVYDVYGANSLDIVPLEEYASEQDANADGFVLHRAFIDGGVVKSGFFMDKYINSKADYNANVSVSVPMGLPIALTANTAHGDTRSGGMTGCTGIYADAVVLSRARGAGYSVASVFMYSAISMIALAHAQHSLSAAYCAWFDATGTKNFPKGCNNDNLGDVDDATLTFVGSGDSKYPKKPRVGSANDLAKTTHNGQLCGIVDVNGTMWEVAIGLTSVGANATDTGANVPQKLYILKETEKLSDLTAGWNTGKDVWGSVTHLSNMYDEHTGHTWAINNNDGYISWGNGEVQVLDEATSGNARAMSGVLPKTNNAVSAGGINLLGKDGVYRYNRANLFVLVGGYWHNGTGAGVFARHLNGSRSTAYYDVSFRATTFPQ